MLGHALEMSEGELRAALQSKRPDERFVAAYAVGERRLAWPGELLPLLLDADDTVRQGARRSLIILSYFELNPGDRDRLRKDAKEWNRPVDLGPPPGAAHAARQSAKVKWAAWWEDRKKVDWFPKVGGKGNGKSKVELAGRTWTRQLMAAGGAEQQRLIAGHKDGRGAEYTDELADAAEVAPGELRTRLREALAERLCRMTAGTLKTYLSDPRPEVRRAAVLALAMTEKQDAIGQMIGLLEDRNPSVVRAAHAALKSLTGRDFGPAVDATDAERAVAAEKWKGWYATRSVAK